MPLSAAGEKVRRAMRNKYGKETGDRIFFSKENSDDSFKKLVRKGAVPGSLEWWLIRLLTPNALPDNRENRRAYNAWAAPVKAKPADRKA